MAIRRSIIDIIGLATIQHRIDALNDRVKREIKEELATTALADVETPAKRMVPVDTGRLRASIHSVIPESPNDLFVDVIADVEYADKIHRYGGTGGRGKNFLEIPLQRARTGLNQRITRIITRS